MVDLAEMCGKMCGSDCVAEMCEIHGPCLEVLLNFFTLAGLKSRLSFATDVELFDWENISTMEGTMLHPGQVKAPLDPGFSPLILAKKKYLEAAKECKDP